MIADTNRAYWFGASDAKYVMAENQATNSWKEFWQEKCGVIERDFNSIATDIGTALEHPILDSIDKSINKDRQILLEDMRLRVNYDGDKDGIIFEVKTHNAKNDFLTKNAEYQFLPKHIYGQVQVQMYAWKTAHERGQDIPELKGLYVVEYPLYEADYSGDTDVDFGRIKMHKIKYDKGFAKQYKKRLDKLAERLREEANEKIE